MGEPRKTWKDKVEIEAFKPKLLELMQEYKWGRTNPTWKAQRHGLEESAEAAEEAYNLLRRGRHSAGQAGLLKCKIQESKLQDLKTENEMKFLLALDKLGIDREWKNNEGFEGDPRLWFHFNGVESGLDKDPKAKPGTLKPGTLDMTDAEELA